MIIFVDPFNRGLSHVPVNVGVIETALLSSPHDELMIAAEGRHAAELIELLDPRFHGRIGRQIELHLPAAGSRFTERFRGDSSSLAKAFGASTGNAALIVADLAPATLHALRLQTLMHPRAFCQVIAMLHGNASEIAGWRAKNPLVRITQLRTAMSWAPRRTRFVVLEQSIQRAILDIAPEFIGRISSLPHPLPLREVARPKVKAATERLELANHPVRIAFLGAAQEKKGFGSFLDLARRLAKHLPGAVEFHAIGWLPTESEGLDFSCLSRRPAKEKLSREEFVGALFDVDYVCMPYDPDLYRFSASGTLVDAIAAGKPVLALRSPTLDDLVRSFGDIGEISDTTEQLASRIEALIRARDTDRYRTQVATMRAIAKARSPHQLIATWQAIFTNDD